MAEENIMINDLFIQILSGLIIAALFGAFTFGVAIRRCVHKLVQDNKLQKKGIAVVLKLLVEDTGKNHPNSKHITEIDKIYKEIVEDSD